LFEDGVFSRLFLTQLVIWYIQFSHGFTCFHWPFIVSNCLQISGLRMRGVTWNRFPIWKMLLVSTTSTWLCPGCYFALIIL